MTRRAVLMLGLLAMGGLLGCSTAEKRTYQVDVINRSSRPVSAGLVKNGPPAETAWAAP